MIRSFITVSAIAFFAAAISTQSAQADWSTYVIRQANSVSPVIQSNNTYVPGATEFVIAASGQKAGWGTSDLDGSTLADISNLSITRLDDTTRFNVGSGPAVGPYLNIWVTDGTHFAVLANEPSNGSFAPFRTVNAQGQFTYSFSMADIASQPVQVYETLNGGYGSTTTWVHDLLGNQALTFADVMSLQIAAPSAAYIAAGNNVGTGAPRELGTNIAYGINWVFGDSLSNYVTGAEGYVVINPSAVPEPASLGLIALGGIALLRRRRHA